MCENLGTWRSARLAAAGKEGVEIWLRDRGTEGFEHSCDKTGETFSPWSTSFIPLPLYFGGFRVNCSKVETIGRARGLKIELLEDRLT